MARAEIGLLEVQLLGEFTLRYGGERVVVGKNSSPRFLQLLQLLWLKGEEGLTKAQIMDALYETDTLTNVNNSFNNLVYQMRKQMIAAGLPDEDYIVRRRGIYIPDRAVPLKVDVQEFRDYMDEGDRAAGDEGRVKAYKAAAEIYTGELLPDMPVTPWIVEESIMLKALYERCVSWLAGYYRREGMTEELLKLYRRASAIYQDNDWKAGEIECLAELGRYQEAAALYKTAVRYCRESLGITPPPHLQEAFRTLQQKAGAAAADEAEEGNVSGGAYYCSYDSFIDVYRVLSRNFYRIGRNVMLMTCTISEPEGVKRKKAEKKAITDAMRIALQRSVRDGDAYTNCGENQFLVLLAGMNRDSCENLYTHIMRSFKEIAGPDIEFECVYGPAEERMPEYEARKKK